MTKNQRQDPLDRLRPPTRAAPGSTVDVEGEWVGVVDPVELPALEEGSGLESRGRHRSGAPPTVRWTVAAGRMRRTLVSAAAVIVIGAVVAGALLWWWSLVHRSDQGILLTTAPTVGVTAAVGPAVPSTPPTTLGSTGVGASATVHVAGAVVDPGVVIVSSGSRVLDVIAAAGGLAETADPDAVNLARQVEDGEMVVVPTPGQVVPGQPVGALGPGPQVGSGSGIVDLNHADAAALDTLPGIGPVLADRIIGYRDDAGPFTAVEDLRSVPGIGDKVFDGLRDLVTV